MIHATFYEPNFLCHVHDGDGQHYEWLCYAETEDALHKRLKSWEYSVDSIAPYDFALWRGQVAEESNRLVEARRQGQQLNFKTKIWSQLKQHLFDLFHGKCAYCESKVLHISSGDVEHYRPKRKVEEDPTHSGYYWLAYDISNLLPCCEKCNRARGKMNRFPVAGARAYSPGAPLDSEHPEMLNPFLDNPQEHLAFAPPIIEPHKVVCVGTIEGLDRRGKETVTICHLDRKLLNDERKKEQEQFINDILMCMVRLDVEKVTATWRQVYAGERPYSAAVLATRMCLSELTHVGGGDLDHLA